MTTVESLGVANSFGHRPWFVDLSTRTQVNSVRMASMVCWLLGMFQGVLSEL